jgi:NDP-sugar pyrophosphorylase family protein
LNFNKYNGKNTELKIPPSIGDRPVTEIGEKAFVKKGLVSVVIPDSVIFIGNLAFADNQIGSVRIGANVYIAKNREDIL